MTAARMSRRRIAHLLSVLTERDRSIIAMLGTLHLATGNQLRRVHWQGDVPANHRAARRTLKRLTDWRVLVRLERRLGGLGRGSESYTYALDVAGQRLLRGGAARRPRLPGQTMWAHALLVSEV